MSDAFYFDCCPNCNAEISDKDFGDPELGGYIGDTVKCSKCGHLFTITATLEEVNDDR